MKRTLFSLSVETYSTESVGTFSQILLLTHSKTQMFSTKRSKMNHMMSLLKTHRLEMSVYPFPTLRIIVSDGFCIIFSSPVPNREDESPVVHARLNPAGSSALTHLLLTFTPPATEPTCQRPPDCKVDQSSSHFYLTSFVSTGEV